ncbi:response regulator transcription factor [Chitinimonas sp. BJYL2]|uniref:response regulator n=1 Tax=Chitinimonas sp. BJYL2 TaxID=2976696 RepID=UPI0022B2D6DF|nr:response regulator transcription factor [Chitinimonas sp. BJYL2]
MRVLLIDDHALFRDGLAALLQRLDEGVAVTGVGNCNEALACLAQDALPDLVLLDLELAEESGMTGLARLQSHYPGLPVVVVSGHDEPAVILRAIGDGAMGFIPKSVQTEVMIAALRLILAGGIYVPTEVLMSGSGRPLPAPARAVSPEDLGLSPRQAQVLQRVLQGMSNKQICRDLDISTATVKSHISAILRLLNVTTRTQAVIEASRLGLCFDR